MRLVLSEPKMLHTLAILVAIGAEPEGGTAVVVAQRVEVLAAPDLGAFLTGTLRRGDIVTIVDEVSDGWLAIEPPEGSLSWIDQAALGEVSGDEARVTAARAAVRPGLPGARMPGPPRTTIDHGELVRLLDVPPLELKQGRATRVWRAIEPPRSEERFIRAESVRRRPGPIIRRTQAPAGASDWPAPRPLPQVEIDPSLTQAGQGPGEAPLAPGLAHAVAPVEAMHRAVLRQPIDQWQLDQVRQRYQGLLDTETDAASRTILRSRLARIDRQEAAAKAARDLLTVLSQSRQLDQELAIHRQHVERANAPERLPYDAMGLLQASARQVDGQKVFALIDRQGRTSCYLSVPPGLAAEHYLTRQVGVRGTVRYSAALDAYLIGVKELDPLSDRP